MENKRKSSTNKKLDFRSKEEEYIRLNVELESKTASLVQEAERVLKEQVELLNKPTESPFDPLVNDEIDPTASNVLVRSKTAGFPNYVSSSISKKTSTTPSQRRAKSAADHVALIGGDMAREIERIQGEAAQDVDTARSNKDIGSDLGAEAATRFLKAKLRVMQEELDRMAHETSKKEDECTTLTMRVRELEEEKGSHQRQASRLQSQLEKQKRLSDDMQRKNEDMELKSSVLKKELDSLKKDQKTSTTSHSATEVRLNRALEEVEKFKSQLQKQRQTSRDLNDNDKRKLENLVVENKRLMKQRDELMNGFKKQIRLIDLLKRQRMHIEAAKLLQFTEEEFVKALDFDAS